MDPTMPDPAAISQAAAGAPPAPPMAPPGPPKNAIQPNPNQTVGGAPNRMFDGPIPGQSLTREPGQYPYEHPPEFVDLDAALGAIMTSLRKPKMFNELLNLMEIGTPIKGIVGTMVMCGFQEGKWSPDIAMLMVKPLTALLMRICMEAKIKPVSGIEKAEDPTMDQVVTKRLKELKSAPVEAPRKGLMSPPKKAK